MAGLSRDLIVERARELIELDGYEALSLRSLGRELGVTAPALYDHVDSKQHILGLVARVGYDELRDRVSVDRDRAVDRVRSSAHAYVAFALENRELFRLMLLYPPADIPSAADSSLDDSIRVLDTGMSDVQAAIDEGDFAPADPFRIAVALWAATHGVATVLVMAPDLGPQLIDDVVDPLLTGFGIRAT
ncbi:MAG: TetR/AcrR family transcriptional regulator [Acidimicrobiia bacterium]|nr:TetR/AcrR family transcriptional regulator [Acidimicrobiia bacterium]